MRAKRCAVPCVLVYVRALLAGGGWARAWCACDACVCVRGGAWKAGHVAATIRFRAQRWTFAIQVCTLPAQTPIHPLTSSALPQGFDERGGVLDGAVGLCVGAWLL